MTACLYISPPDDVDQPGGTVMAVLISDSLATLRINPQGIPKVVPATINSLNYQVFSYVRLVRKIKIWDDTAAACAGDAARIEQFLYELGMQLPGLRMEDRPMGRVASWPASAGVEAIVVHQMKNGLVNTALPQNKIHFRHFGMCAAIGSGKEELLDRVKYFNDIYECCEPVNAYTKAISLALYIAADRLAAEMTGDDYNHWGGYVEWVFYSNGIWRFGPSVAHVFYHIDQKSDLDFLSKKSKVIAYEPNKGSGEILTFDERSPILYPLSAIDYDADSSDHDIKKWIGWAAENFTVTFTFSPLISNNIERSTIVVNPDDMRLINFSVTENDGEIRIQLDLDHEYGNRILNAAIRHAGIVFD
jgi:hypothetical protein